MKEQACGIPREEALPLAMAYVPWQKWRELYTPEVGLQRGTIFAELDKPFLGGEAFCDE